MSGIGHIGELQIINDLQKNHGFEIYLPLKRSRHRFYCHKK